MVTISFLIGGKMFDYTVGILGLGNLGSKIAERLTKVKKGFKPKMVMAVERQSNKDTLARLKLKSVDLSELSHADVLIVAVKPGQFAQAWQSIAGQSQNRGQLVISLMAKVNLAELGRVTGSASIARAMTTTACVIGRGVGVWQASQGMSETDSERVKNILDVLGEHQQTETEEHFVYATVLSSLYGLMFELGYDFERAMNEIGSPLVYRQLVWEIMVAAAQYQLCHKDDHALKHADQVTSPNGTTSAMRLEVARAGLPAIFADAFRASANRAK